MERPAGCLLETLRHAVTAVLSKQRVLVMLFHLHDHCLRTFCPC